MSCMVEPKKFHVRHIGFIRVLELRLVNPLLNVLPARALYKLGNVDCIRTEEYMYMSCKRE